MKKIKIYSGIEELKVYLVKYNDNGIVFTHSKEDKFKHFIPYHRLTLVSEV